MIPGEIKYKSLLERLQATQKEWVKNYLEEISTLKVISGLSAQIKELEVGRGELKAVILDRLNLRVSEISRKLDNRSEFIANRLIRGESQAGRPASEDFDSLIMERLKLADWLIPKVKSLDTDANDKRIKRIDTEISDRKRSIGDLQRKLADKKYRINRYPFRPDGVLNVSADGDLYALYLEQLIEFSRGLPGEIQYNFTDLEKLLLLSKGIKVVNTNDNGGSP